ncbi:MAG: aminotransferase class IV [Planctomycetia bacterium]|nr:aminotransferase class IV [Planctomycetia bacterium]
MPEPLAFLNGRFLPAPEARLPVYDAGIVLGTSVSEVLRTFRRQPFRLADHLQRLAHSLRCIHVDSGVSDAQFVQIIDRLIAHNGAALPAEDDLGIVIFVTPGPYPGYANPAAHSGPTICVHTFELRYELWADKLEHGLHVVTPPVRHVPPACVDPQVKQRSRIGYYLADWEARQVDPQAAALLLDLDGNVTELSTANLLVVQGHTLHSPSQRQILPGVSRAVTIELAGNLGMSCEERPLGVSDVAGADEALATSTPYCVLPVTRINGRPIGNGKPGRVFRRLAEAWSELVGLDIARQIVEGAKRRQNPAGSETAVRSNPSQPRLP